MFSFAPDGHIPTTRAAAKKARKIRTPKPCTHLPFPARKFAGWRRQQRGNMSPASGPLQLARRRCRLFGCPSLRCWGVRGLVCGGRTRSVPETSQPHALSVGGGAIPPNPPCVPPAGSRTLVFSGGGCGSLRVVRVATLGSPRRTPLKRLGGSTVKNLKMT